MRIPERALQFAELVKALDGDGLQQVLDVLVDIDDSRYLHWDEIRHRQPPHGLSHKQWWAAIKLGRERNARPIDEFVSTTGENFEYTLPDMVLEAVHLIDSQSRGSIGVHEPNMSRADRNRYMVSSLIEEAITSSQLEGAATTRKEAVAMLRSGRKPQDQSERMIVNNYLAMQEILKIAGQELTPDVVLNLHRILTLGTLKNPDACGRLQLPEEERVKVYDERDNSVLHIPPPAELLPERLRLLCDFANGKTKAKGFLHPVIRAIVLHFWLAYDHPFEDGNGRTARALFYWAMLRSGYWLFEYLSISSLLKKAPGQYARSYLHTETDGNDLTYFIASQLRVIQLSLVALDKYLDRKQKEIQEAESRILDSAWMNHRQRALVAHALRHPTHQYTIESHRNSHRVAYATARADLLALATRGMLDQHKQGKKIVFVPNNKLAKLGAR